MYGYRGVMFPWESDDSGEEACPVWALTGTLEQHITADIAIAAWNYYCVTKDREWLRTSGYPLISQAADFVASRMHKNSDGSYSFLNVVGADEYALQRGRQCLYQRHGTSMFEICPPSGSSGWGEAPASSGKR